MEAKLENDARCPCQSGESYAACCGPLHRGEAHAPTAERLMRSRYSAFAVGDSAYLIETWHPSTRPESLELDPGMRWFSLEILSRTAGGMLDSNGVVEFRARYRLDGEVGEQRETSRFVRENRRWFYVDGR
jgi:SEC-C motif domain protein